MPIVAWHHTSLAVDDLDRAIAFYRDAFGFSVTFEERGMAREIRSMTGKQRLSCDIAMLKREPSDQMLELIRFRGGGRALDLPVVTGAGHVAFLVKDLAEALDAVEAHGARSIGKVTVFPEGRAVYCREPGGSFFELEELMDGEWAKG